MIDIIALKLAAIHKLQLNIIFTVMKENIL